MPKNEFWSKIVELNLSQPNFYTCQSACIGMVVKDADIMGIRKKLERAGDPGNPYTMGKIIKQYPVNYAFEEDASLSEVREWLKNGESLITHGWFTNSGHVICLDGLEIDTTTLSYRLSVKDPWGEFDAPKWKYIPSTYYFDGWYSSYCIYASCVASSSVSHARTLYRNGILDSRRRGMWVHRITAK
jgi:hypothetical protein